VKNPTILKRHHKSPRAKPNVPRTATPTPRRDTYTEIAWTPLTPSARREDSNSSA
jgi:hypothetical protein